jgi:uncharacterized protein YraI
MLHCNGNRAAGGSPRSGDRAPRRWRLALLSLVLLGELSMVTVPALARLPARSATAIVETRLRAGPERRAEPLLRLPEGTSVTVHGKPENGWYLARRGDLEGYVRTGDLATDAVIPAGSVQPSEIPDDSDVVALEQRASGRSRDRRNGRDRGERRRDSREIITGKDLNLRESPSRTASVVAVMPRGERVEPTGEHRDGFVEVQWQGGIGWAFGKHLAAPRRIAMKAAVNRDRGRGSGSWRRRELIDIIHAAADRYGQSREDMLRVARCESDLVPVAVNGSGGSYGLFQFKPRTWLGTPFGEYDIFDPRANANAAAWMWAQGRRREWVCQ